MEAYQFIEGFEKVVSHLGMWPSFHDAEVIKMTVDRTNVTSSKELSPILDLYLRGWVMNSDTAENGFYKLHGEAVFHFQFEGVTSLHIEGFNNQNVLSALNLDVVDDPHDLERKVLKVELEHCYEFEASFTAKKARVADIAPYAQ